MLRWCQTTIRALRACGITVRNHPPRFSHNASRINSACTSFKHVRFIEDTTSALQPLPYFSNFTRRPYSTVTLDTHALHSPSDIVGASITNPASVLINFFTKRSPKLSVDKLILLYQSCKSQHLLSKLGPKYLTELMSLFGTMSLPDPRRPCIYLSKFTSSVSEPDKQKESSHKEYWGFILEISRDKESMLGQSLNGTDRYWVMRALLTQVAGSPEPSPNDPRLVEATSHYLHIWRHTPDPEIHLPYLHTLLLLPSTSTTHALVHRLCAILEVHANPHSRILDILWHVVVHSSVLLSLQLKARILDMLSVRVSKYLSLEKAKHEVPSTHSPPKYKYGLSEMRTALGTALFPSFRSPISGLPAPAIRGWAAKQANRAFASHLPQSMRWRHLVVLALCRTEPEVPLSQPIWDHKRDTVGLETEHEAWEYPENKAISELGAGTGSSAEAADWHPVLVLSALEQSGFDSRARFRMGAEALGGLQEVVRSLWRTWKTSFSSDNRESNDSVSRAIVAAFFRMATKAKDAPLVEASHRFLVAQGLFTGTGAGESRQIAALKAAHVLASSACQGISWQRFLSENPQYESAYMTSDVVEGLMAHFLSQKEAQDAWGVFVFAKAHSISFSNQALHRLSLAVASDPDMWHLAVPFFANGSFAPPMHRESLLIALLGTLQRERRQHVDRETAQTLVATLSHLYKHNTCRPSAKAKYPVRYFIGIAVASGEPKAAVEIVEAIQRNVASSKSSEVVGDFFSLRFYLRLARTLVRYRQLSLTHRVLHLALPPPPSNSSATTLTPGQLDFRRKVSILLARAGAPAQAFKADSHMSSFSIRRSHNTVLADQQFSHRMWMRRRTAREAMARAVRFRTLKPKEKQALAVVPLLKRVGECKGPQYESAVRYAVGILVRAGWLAAARKLIVGLRVSGGPDARSMSRTTCTDSYADAGPGFISISAPLPTVSSNTHTSLVNTFLHAALRQHRLRNGRLVRHILRSKETLEQSVGFVADRVTINIIVKALLRWRWVVGSEELRKLFDHLIRGGYPAGDTGIAQENVKGVGQDMNVPFNSLLPIKPLFGVPALKGPISFSRHVQPLYKMFVKALYQRGDVRGAKTVVGILKAEEVLALGRREERERERRRGIMRKKYGG